MDKLTRKLVSFGKKRKANLPLALLCICFLYAAAAVLEKAELLWKALRSKQARRLAACALSLCMVANLLPMTAFAAETGTPPGASGSVCGHVHDEECGYIEAVEGAPCSHLNEDGTYSCAPVLDSGVSGNATPSDADYVCGHEDGCGYAEAMEGADCTHSCELCDPTVENPPVETPPDKDAIVTDTCICDALCTEGVINPDCPVCSAEGADLTKCLGKERKAEQCLCDPTVEKDGEHTNTDCPFYVEKAAVCNCSVLCTAEQANTDCPVCNEDYGLCAAEKNAVTPPSDEAAVNAVIMMIDALPIMDSIYENMPGDSEPEFAAWLEKMQKTIEDIKAAKAAYDTLSDGDKKLIDEEHTGKLLDLVNFAEMIAEMMPVAETGTAPGGKQIQTAADLQTALGGNSNATIEDSIVKLTQDVTLEGNLRIKGTVVLDLNGHTLTYAGKGIIDSAYNNPIFLMMASGNLTIKDSDNDGRGTVVQSGGNGSNYDYAINCIAASAQVTIENGIFSGSVRTGSGTITIKNGEFSDLTVDNATAIKISAGTFSEITFMNSTTLRMKDIVADGSYMADNSGKEISGWKSNNEQYPKNIWIRSAAAVEKQTPKITSNLPDDTQFCFVNDSKTLSVTATLEEGTPTYQWYQNNRKDSTSGTKIEGANSSSYTVPTTTVGTTYYYVVVTNPSADVSVTSNIAAVTVSEAGHGPGGTAINSNTALQNALGGNSNATIADNMVKLSQDVTLEGNLRITGTVVLDLNGHTLTYAGKGMNDSSYNNPIFLMMASGNLTIKDSDNGGQGTVVQSGGSGSNYDYAISYKASDAQVTIEGGNFQKGAIAIGLGSLTIHSGSFAGLSISEGFYGGNPTINITNGKFTEIHFMSGTLRMKDIVADGSYMADNSGKEISGWKSSNEQYPRNVWIRNAAAVEKQTPKITSNLPDDTQFCFVSDSKTLSVTATLEEGTPTYQWYQNNQKDSTSGTKIEGANSSSYTVPTTAAGTTYYYVVVTNPSADISVTSNIATVTVSEAGHGPGGTAINSNTALQNALGGNSNATIADNMVKLSQDVTLEGNLRITGTVVLDLNGHTLTYAGKGMNDSSYNNPIFLMMASGNLTIKDSDNGGQGTVVQSGGSGSNYDYAISYKASDAQVTIEGGNFQKGAIAIGLGSLTIHSGSFAGLSISEGFYGGNPTINITNGKFTEIHFMSGTLRMPDIISENTYATKDDGQYLKDWDTSQFLRKVIVVPLGTGHTINYWLQEQINKSSGSSGSPAEITIPASGELISTINIPADKYIKLTGSTLTRAVDFEFAPLFNVKGELTLENITLDGNKDNNASGDGLLEVDGGKLTLNTDAVLQNNSGLNGGAVRICGGGTATMNGGKITGNEALAGGGVFAFYYIGESGGTFIMNGGEISGNTAQAGSGVYITSNSTFNLHNNSVIKDNVAPQNVSSGGWDGMINVEIRPMSSETLTIPNAQTPLAATFGIEFPSSPDTWGGGVYNMGAFTMDGGEISNNTAGRGGAVYHADGSCTITGGVINGNHNTFSGTGLYAREDFSVGGGADLKDGIYLVTNKKALVTSALSNSIQIEGMEGTPAAGTVVAAGSSYTISDTDFGKFSINDTAWALNKNESGQIVLKSTSVPTYAVELLRNGSKVSEHATLADAITAAQSGDKLVITADINLGDNGVDINGIALTLDLNGHTVSHSGSTTGNMAAIELKNTAGTGLTVTDSSIGQTGKLEAVNIAISNVSGGTVTITGGTVSSTGANGDAISGGSNSGEIKVTGGTVSASGANGRAIASAGAVTVESGTVTATSSNGQAISSSGFSGTVTISGGTVSATNGGTAIYKDDSAGAVTISGNAEVISANTSATSGTICLGPVPPNSNVTALEITGGTVKNTAAGGNAVYNGYAGAIAVSGGTVEATGKAIYNISTGKITISGSATVTSANTASNSGTIYLSKVPSGSSDLVVLDIKDTAQVTNTASPAGYAVYFAASGVDGYNVRNYYTVASGAMVGKVYPTPAAMPTVEVDSSGTYTVYANGLPLLIIGTDATSTTVYVDENGNNQVDADEKSLHDLGVANAPADGVDLSEWSVYGGGNQTAVTDRTLITVLSGRVGNVYGGGKGVGANVGSSTIVRIQADGAVAHNVYGGGDSNNVGGSTDVRVYGSVGGDVYGGGMGGDVGMGTNVTVYGVVETSVYGGGAVDTSVTSTVSGGSSVTVGGNAKIGGEGKGVVLNGGTGDSEVTNGVASFQIDPDLTNTASVSVVLPTGIAEGTAIATGAVAGDAAKIHLTGDGATGKTAEFNGTDKTIVVKVAGTTTPTVTSVSVSPSPATVQKGGTQQFTATVSGTNNPAQTVRWTVTGGKTGTSISTGGLLTVISDETAATLTVKATSTVDTGKSGTATVTVQAGALTDAQKLAMAKSAIEAALDNLTVTNATTAQDILGAANAATLHGVAVAWNDTNGFSKTNATANATGSITGTLKLTLGGASGTVTVNKVITKLSADKSALTAAIAAANSAKNGVTVNNGSPSSVANGTKFVTSAEMEALNNAIAAAQAVVNSSSATAADITAAVSALNSAVAAFNSAVKTGTYTGSSSSGSSGSSGGSGGGTVTPPTETKPSAPTESEIKVDGKVDANGNISVDLPQKTVEDAIKKAEDEARRNGNLDNGVTLVLNVQGSSSAGSVTVNLPKTTQETIISNKIVNTIIVVNNPDIKIGIDLSAVKSINTQANADVNITATRLNGAGLTGAAKAAIGSRPVFDLTVNYGGGKQVTSFGGGSVSVAIPYTLGAGEKAGGVYAVYVDGSGTVQWLTGSVYDAGNKMLRFSTNHFSTYGVGYKAPADFTDIVGHWAKDDIQFVVNRGLLSGTGAATFSPNTAMTRGMFVTALGRLAGADVSGCTQSSFTDVKADAYYMGYVEWAAKNGIVKGTTATTFAPDNAVTREQMAVIMANYAKAIGFELPKAHAQNTFADAANISSWAADSVKAMQMAGVLAGKNENRFDPQGTATRAEAAATLRRFVELMIDASSARGWMRNDDGQWMYYESGQPIKNQTKNIGGENYSFNAYGVTLDFPKKKTGYGTYTVQAGDNFWLIAKKHNVSMDTLAEINGKTIYSVIHPGDVLKIPQ